MELNRVLKLLYFIERKGEMRKRDILPCDILNFDLTNLNDDFFRNLETLLARAFNFLEKYNNTIIL